MESQINTDNSTKGYHYFNNTVNTRYVKIKPETWFQHSFTMEGFSSNNYYDATYIYTTVNRIKSTPGSYYDNYELDGGAWFNQKSNAAHIRLGRVMTSADENYFLSHSKHSPTLNNMNNNILGRWYVWGGNTAHTVYWSSDTTTDIINRIITRFKIIHLSLLPILISVFF